MCHPILRAVQVRSAGTSQAREDPTVMLPKQPGRARGSARAWTGLGLLHVPLPSSPQPRRAQHFSPCPSLPSPPQVLLLGAPPAAGSAGSSRAGHHLHHLHGACGGQHVLPHHGVPNLQSRLVPPALHPGRSPPLTLRARQLLSSTRARSPLTACVPAAGTRHVCRHSLLPVPHMQRQDTVLSRDVPHGDPNPSQVGIPLPCS